MITNLPHQVETSVLRRMADTVRTSPLAAGFYERPVGPLAEDLAEEVLTALDHELERNEVGLVEWPHEDSVALIFPGGHVAEAVPVFVPGRYHVEPPLWTVETEGTTVVDHARVVVVPEWAGRARLTWWRFATYDDRTGQRHRPPVARLRHWWLSRPLAGIDGAYLVASAALALSAAIGDTWPRMATRLDQWATNLEDDAEARR